MKITIDTDKFYFASCSIYVSKELGLMVNQITLRETLKCPLCGEHNTEFLHTDNQGLHHHRCCNDDCKCEWATKKDTDAIVDAI